MNIDEEVWLVGRFRRFGRLVVGHFGAMASLTSPIHDADEGAAVWYGPHVVCVRHGRDGSITWLDAPHRPRRGLSNTTGPGRGNGPGEPVRLAGGRLR